MDISLRSCLTAGVATITAAAVAFGPSVQPMPAAQPPPVVHVVSPPIQLLALAEQPPLLDVLLSSPLRLLGPAAPLGTLPSAPAPLAIPIAPNLANTIDGIYTAVEPWVRYGFEVATSIVRWIPYVGWFAGQIMVFYNFFESMVASGVFNFTDFLRGDGGIGTNLVDFGIDVGLAFVWLGLDEVAQFIPLPPFCCYPPRPPVQGPFLAANALAGPTETADTVTALAAADATLVDEKRSTVKSEDLAEAQDATTNVVEKKAEVDVVKEAKEPKEPKEPKATDVSAQGEVRSAPDADSTESTTVSNDDTGKKKADNGPKVKGTTDSSTSASDDNKKSDDTGKKADKE